jgi:hypothetical protein
MYRCTFPRSVVPLASLMLAVTLATIGPVQANCTGICQASHSPTTGLPTDVLAGDCKSGTPTGGPPGGWDNTQTCSGIGGIGSQASWTVSLVSVTHDSNCINTGSQACQPCGYGIGQSGPCAAPPVTQVDRSRHYWENSMGVPQYDHTWTTNFIKTCACGFHGCN